MFTGTISDSGLNYSSESVNDIGVKLNEYIQEEYGPYSVQNVSKETTYSGCQVITSPGEYLIKLKKDPRNEIYCTIS